MGPRRVNARPGPTTAGNNGRHYSFVKAMPPSSVTVPPVLNFHGVIVSSANVKTGKKYCSVRR